MSEDQQKLKVYLSQKIKQYRKDHYIGQKQFACLVGVGQPALGSYEEQRAFPKGNALSRILSVLNISFEKMIKESSTILLTELVNKET